MQQHCKKSHNNSSIKHAFIHFCGLDFYTYNLVSDFLFWLREFWENEGKVTWHKRSMIIVFAFVSIETLAKGEK